MDKNLKNKIASLAEDQSPGHHDLQYTPDQRITSGLLPKVHRSSNDSSVKTIIAHARVKKQQGLVIASFSVQKSIVRLLLATCFKYNHQGLPHKTTPLRPKSR